MHLNNAFYYAFVSLLIVYIVYLFIIFTHMEGFNNYNSPLYSHNVNLPINDPVSCQNFCGPKAQCAITREQCTSDIDCYGCNPGPTKEDECLTKDVKPYDATGKLGQNQGLQYSPLTTGFNNHNINFAETYPGSKDAEIIPYYQGSNSWTKSFNAGLQLYNDKRRAYDKFSGYLEEPDIAPSKLSYYEPKYPTTISATGQFFQTTPPASNSAL
jgi:hypothetical protein